MTHANVIQVANAFATSRKNREEVLETLSGFTKKCSNRCGECPLPQAVKASFKDSVALYLRANLACLRQSQ